MVKMVTYVVYVFYNNLKVKYIYYPLTVNLFLSKL